MSKKLKPKKKLSTAEVAKHLGASAVVPLNLKGLEIVFCVPIRQTDGGSIVVTNSGAVFPPKCITGFDTDRSSIILSEDYDAWYSLTTDMVLFMSSALSRPSVRVGINKIASINKLSSGLNLLPLIF